MVFEPRRVDAVVSRGVDPELVGHIDIAILVDRNVPIQRLDLIHHILITFPCGPAKRTGYVRFPTLSSGRGPGLKALRMEVLTAGRPAPDDRLLAVTIEASEADRTVAIDRLAALGLFGFHHDRWSRGEYVSELVAQETELVDEFGRRVEDFVEDLKATTT